MPVSSKLLLKEELNTVRNIITFLVFNTRSKLRLIDTTRKVFRVILNVDAQIDYGLFFQSDPEPTFVKIRPRHPDPYPQPCLKGNLYNISFDNNIFKWRLAFFIVLLPSMNLC